MRFKKLLSGCASAAVLLWVAPLGAATRGECTAAKPTAASYTWNFQAEANDIFQDLHSDALQAMNHSADLQSWARTGEMSWQGQADQLTRLKAEVNDMGKKVCRLETIRRVVAPWQQKMIDRVAQEIQLMADNTQDAIAYGNSNQEHLWSPTYQKYMDNLYNQSSRMTTSTEDAVAYANVLERHPGLRQDLGVGS